MSDKAILIFSEGFEKGIAHQKEPNPCISLFEGFCKTPLIEAV
jgi:hypothetical protein